MESKSIIAAFKALRAETKSLNATLRNIVEVAKSNKAMKDIANELGINGNSIKGAAKDELRKKLLEELPYYTTDGGVTLPCNLRKVAEVENVTYYRYVTINWTAALQLICNRRAKGLDSKHVNVKLTYNYTVSKIGEETKKEVITYSALYKDNGATLIEDGETMLAVDFQANKDKENRTLGRKK